MQQKSQVVRLFQAIMYLFPGRERWWLVGAVCVAFVSAVFETVGIASILPFMSVILDPTVIDRYPSLRTITSTFGAGSRSEELIVLGSVLALLFVLGNMAGAFNGTLQERWASRSGARIAGDLFSEYMKQSFAFHTQRDSASLLKVLFEDVDNLRRNVFLPLLNGTSRLFLVLLIIVILLIRDPVTTIAAATLFSGAYLGVFRVIRKSLGRKGKRFFESNGIRLRIAQESLGGIRELKVLCREQMPINQFERLSLQAGRDESATRIIAAIPRYVFETVAFGGVLIGILWLVGQRQDPATFIPALSLYVFAGYRLLPAIQQIFNSSVQIRFSLDSLYAVHDDLVRTRAARAKLQVSDSTARQGPVEFKREITFDDVSFSYDIDKPPSLSHVNLKLRPMESVGLIGRTGAGKSTLADLILGLSQPTMGAIAIDGMNLSKSNIRAWRAKVGYVPQQIFLANATVAENIGFGLEKNTIDMHAVRKAVALAQVEEFVLSLPQKYETVVGERGVKLSGGQRQRLGIARALYNEPELLVMDEATSALDGLTEEAVMKAIATLSTKITVILIAHRLRTVQTCQRIILLDRGCVVADGSYEDLLKTSAPFVRLVKAGVHDEHSDNRSVSLP